MNQSAHFLLLSQRPPAVQTDPRVLFDVLLFYLRQQAQDIIRDLGVNVLCHQLVIHGMNA